jgi:hypothetical protein
MNPSERDLLAALFVDDGVGLVVEQPRPGGALMVFADETPPDEIVRVVQAIVDQGVRQKQR